MSDDDRDLAGTYDRFWMRVALGRPEDCSEEVSRLGQAEPCDKPAVALRIDPEEGQPYPVCARHARAEMVPLVDIVRFMLDRHQAQRLIAEYFVDAHLGHASVNSSEEPPNA